MHLAASTVLASLALSLLAGSAAADAPAADTAADAPAVVHRTAEGGPEHVVLTNLFMMPFGVFNVEYERALGERWSAAAAVTAIYTNGTPFDASVRSRGFGANLGARYYVTGSAPQGLFAAAFVRAFYVSLEEERGMAEGPAVGGGAMLGYAHVFWSRLHVSAAAGAHVLWGDAAGTHLMPTGRAIDPELRLAVGVAF
jgi:hypothetical protein